MSRSIDRLTIFALLATATLPFAALSPAQASSAESCTVQAEQVRTLAEGADPKVAVKALRNAAIGEKLCEAGNRHEAGKKFSLALTQLDTTLQVAGRN